jgi:hypothetical protein
MYHLHLVRPVKAAPRSSEKRSAKVIHLEARREARRQLRSLPSADRPDAA